MENTTLEIKKKKKGVIHVFLDERLYERIVELSKQTSLPISSIARFILIREIERLESLFGEKNKDAVGKEGHEHGKPQ